MGPYFQSYFTMLKKLELKKKKKIGGEMTWKFEIFCMLTEILNKSIQFKIKSVSKIQS